MSIYGTPINDSPVVNIKAGGSIAAPAYLAATAAGAVAGAGVHALGIFTPDNDQAVVSGDDLTVQIKDIGTWMAGGTFSAGAELASDANGKAITAASGKFILAVALKAATAAGQLVPVQIIKAGYKPS